MSNHRCHCGGIMDLKAKYNAATEANEVWYVCPFCHTQRPASARAAAQAEQPDEVLTQPVRR